LLCGDSTDSDQVAKLMNGQKADMVFTDPPYGISHSGKGIKGSAKENDFGEILGDNDVTVAIDSFIDCNLLRILSSVIVANVDLTLLDFIINLSSENLNSISSDDIFDKSLKRSFAFTNALKSVAIGY
jgi:tRNA G10  N-methylase Trm11